VPDYQLRGWLKQRGASYLNVVDPETARTLQANARIDSNYILKTPTQVTARPLSANANQAAAAAQYMSDNYSTMRNFELGIEALLRDLTPSTESGSHKRFEAAFEKLGFILGFDSYRPDKETGRGPDNLWAMSAGRHWVVEAKSEATSATIKRDYLGQLSHSADWFEAAYPSPSLTTRRSSAGRSSRSTFPSSASRCMSTRRDSSTGCTSTHAQRGYGGCSIQSHEAMPR